MLTDKRILIIEDQALIALDIALSVQDLGGEVEGPYCRLATAIKALEHSHIDGAILDVDLDDGDSFPLAEKLQRDGVPFLFQTGRTDIVAIENRFAATQVYRKPILPERVAVHLADLM